MGKQRLTVLVLFMTTWWLAEQSGASPYAIEASYNIKEFSPHGRQKRAWSVLQRNWRMLLKGARLVGKQDNLRVYEKKGFYDEALKDFYSLQPQYVSQTTTEVVEVYGRVGNTEIYLRGKSPDLPPNVHAVLHIDGKHSATQWQLPSDFRITKEIVYVSN